MGNTSYAESLYLREIIYLFETQCLWRLGSDLDQLLREKLTQQSKYLHGRVDGRVARIGPMVYPTLPPLCRESWPHAPFLLFVASPSVHSWAIALTAPIHRSNHLRDSPTAPCIVCSIAQVVAMIPNVMQASRELWCFAYSGRREGPGNDDNVEFWAELQRDKVTNSKNCYLSSTKSGW